MGGACSGSHRPSLDRRRDRIVAPDGSLTSRITAGVDVRRGS